MEYTVITRDNCSLQEFIDAVNEAIRNGWKPQGGYFWNNRAYYQAMIR